MAVSACRALALAFIPSELDRLAPLDMTEARKAMINDVKISRQILIVGIACVAIGKIGAAFCVDNRLGFWSFAFVGLAGGYLGAFGSLTATKNLNKSTHY
ncbi:MAG: hypothetical protein JSR76_07405 [Verrucomicrobia bacterium]|nr:hypothetical protein [Verrucomicrobiota bacterium]